MIVNLLSGKSTCATLITLLKSREIEFKEVEQIKQSQVFLLYVLIMNAFYKFKMISHSNNNVYNSHEH
jgi:hypothetical protein